MLNLLSFCVLFVFLPEASSSTVGLEVKGKIKFTCTLLGSKWVSSPWPPSSSKHAASSSSAQAQSQHHLLLWKPATFNLSYSEVALFSLWAFQLYCAHSLLLFVFLDKSTLSGSLEREDLCLLENNGIHSLIDYKLILSSFNRISTGCSPRSPEQKTSEVCKKVSVLKWKLWDLYVYMYAYVCLCMFIALFLPLTNIANI